MHNILRIARRDIMRLLRVPTAWIIIIGLIVLPAFYAWVNIIGFWDPYGNTSHVQVSVANEDTGTTDETLGDLNLGSQIVDSLHSNHDIGWVFTNKDDAMHDVRSGASYAAIIIPKDFSERLTRIIHGDMADGRPQLEYYVNEKVSPIAPKVTDTAATTVDRQVNATFVSAVSEAVTQAANRIDDNVQQLTSQTRTDAQTALTNADTGISAARKRIADFISADKDSAIQQARDALSAASQLGNDTATALTSTSGILTSTQTGITDFTTTASGALANGESLLTTATGKATGSLSSMAAAITTANGQCSGALETLRDMTDRGDALASDLDALADRYPAIADTVRQAADRLRASNATVQDTIDSLQTLNASITATATDTGTLATDFATASNTTLQHAADARTTLIGGTLPQLNAGLGTLATASGTLGGQLVSQQSLVSQASLIIDQLDQALKQTATALSDTDKALADVQTRLSTLRTDLDALASANTASELLGVDGKLDADRIASFMLSPTVLDTKTMYPVNSYGSGMAPLFTNLAMWAGVFMLVALLKLETDDEGIDDMTDTQAYMGRWLLLAVLAALQGLTVTVGDLVIGVQAASAPVFVATGILASVVYSAVAYMLATTLQHVGKALVIAMIIVQIPGAGGLYPIEMMPSFFRSLHPFFPFTYTIDAMRETIGGFYGDTWLTAILHLLLFAAIAFAVGIFVRPLMANVNRLFARQIAQTGILNGEPASQRWHRYRLTQVLRVLSNREEYRRLAAERAAWFSELYPRLKRGALIAGFAVPIVLAVTFSLNTDAKLAMLGAWTVWVLLIIAFLMGIEMVRDGIRRQIELGNLDDEEIRIQLALRELDRTRGRRRMERRRERRHDVRHVHGAHGDGGHAEEENLS